MAVMLPALASAPAEIVIGELVAFVEPAPGLQIMRPAADGTHPVGGGGGGAVTVTFTFGEVDPAYRESPP